MADNGDDNQQQGSNGADPQDPSGPKGKPDENQKAKRESLEQRVKDLEAELEASKQREQTLNTSLEKALTEDDINDEVKAAQEKAKAASDKAASDWAAREKNLTVTNALLAAGCTDTVALIAHLDMNEIEVAKDGHISGLDTAKLAETYPYQTLAKPLKRCLALQLLVVAARRSPKKRSLRPRTRKSDVA